MMVGYPAGYFIYIVPFGELLSAVGVFTTHFLREHGFFVPARIFRG